MDCKIENLGIVGGVSIYIYIYVHIYIYTYIGLYKEHI